MTKEQDMILAREVAARVLRGRGMPSPTAEADMVERGEWDHHGYVEGALAAIQAERAAVAAYLRGVLKHDTADAIERGDHHDRNG